MVSKPEQEVLPKSLAYGFLDGRFSLNFGHFGVYDYLLETSVAHEPAFWRAEPS